MVTAILTLFFNLNTVLPQLINQFGNTFYLLIFLLIFIETGVVVLPFLPGDSLLFLCGSLAAMTSSSLNPVLLIMVTGLAATLGDSLNFEIGKLFGHHISNSANWRKIIKPQNLQKSELFFQRHGNPAIFLGRFIPVVRTLVPFTAGGSKMTYRNFLIYNVAGGFSWVVLGVMSGFIFGNVEMIRDNFSLIMVVIVMISLIPMIFVAVRNHLVSKRVS